MQLPHCRLFNAWCWCLCLPIFPLPKPLISYSPRNVRKMCPIIMALIGRLLGIFWSYVRRIIRFCLITSFTCRRVLLWEGVCPQHWLITFCRFMRKFGFMIALLLLNPFCIVDMMMTLFCCLNLLVTLLHFWTTLMVSIITSASLMIWSKKNIKFFSML